MSGNRRIRRDDLQKALLAIAAVFFLIGIGGIVISKWENAKYASGGTATVDIDTVLNNDDTVEKNGVTYERKDKLRTYLVMGVDSDKAPISHANGGQADLQIAVIIDDENKTWQLMPLDRDTMVFMDVYDDQDNLLGQTVAQLTLAHSHSSWEVGAKNTVKTVSRMLKGQKITGYVSANLQSIYILNDAVGGVPVTVTTDFTAVDPSLVLGEEIILDGKQAETFVRSRMTVDNGTNEARMARQEAYLNGLMDKVSGLSDAELLDIYDRIAENSVTNVGSGDFVDLVQITKDYEHLPNIKIEGEHLVNNGLTEFRMDEESLDQLILDVFYEKQEAGK